jgi:hypothetical protein
MDIDKNVIDVTTVEYFEEPLSVISLKTDNIDTYFAGESKVLVHSEFAVQVDQ